MGKRNISFHRLLISGAESAFLTGLVEATIFKTSWKFDIFSLNYWNLIWQKWINGWIIKSQSEVLFILATISIPVVFFILWFVFYKIDQRTLLLAPLKIFKSKQKQTKINSVSDTPVSAKKNSTAARVSLPSELGRLRGTPVKSQIAEPKAPPQTVPVEHQNASKITTKPAVKKTAQSKSALWNKLADSLESAGVFIFREMRIGNCAINILTITGESISLLCEIPDDAEEWTVDERAIMPTWVSESGLSYPSPSRTIYKARETLKEYIKANMPAYANMDVNACLVIEHGKFKNVSTLLNYLEENDLTILRMGDCREEQLPETSILVDYIKSQPKSDQALNDAVAVAILDLMEADDV